MADRFGFVKYDEISASKLEIFKDRFKQAEDAIVLELGEGRAKSLALTRLEETYMWIGKQLRDDQIARNAKGATQ